jgi:leader peptidase (prepilin peptidase)/N-methyltransferase
VAASVYGVAIGSFLNVVIWRLPRGVSIASPTWSYCPRCEHRLGAFDLFPVLSFLLLRAKCRYCGQPISWRYPGVEALTGLLFAVVTWHTWQAGGMWYDAVFFCLFTAILICVFFIDLEHFVIDDGLCVLGILLGLAHGLVTGTAGDALAGLFGYAAVIYFIGLVSYVVLVSLMDRRMSVGRASAAYLRDNAEDWAYNSLYYLGTLVPPVRRWVETRWGEKPPLEGFTGEEIEADEDAGGMGSGDGKLAAAIGANLGLSLAFGSLGFAIFLGALGGLVVMARQRRRLGERIPIPFGPSMALGALLALFYGHAVAAWYLARFWGGVGSPGAASAGFFGF